MLSVRMDPIPIVTAAAVQELNAKVNERDARIEALEKENRRPGTERKKSKLGCKPWKRGWALLILK